MLGAKVAQSLQISGRWRNDAHVSRHRLDDEAGQILGVPGKKFVGGIQIVVWREEGIVGDGLGTPGLLGTPRVRRRCRPARATNRRGRGNSRCT